MKNRFSACVTVLLLLAAVLHGAEAIDDALKRAALEYAQRLHLANEELTQTRERIAREKEPLLRAMRAAEDRIVAAQAQITRLTAIIDPLGRVIAGPCFDEETILCAELDLDEIARGKFDLDVTGHYARPDVFQLHVDEEPKRPVS